MGKPRPAGLIRVRRRPPTGGRQSAHTRDPREGNTYLNIGEILGQPPVQPRRRRPEELVQRRELRPVVQDQALEGREQRLEREEVAVAAARAREVDGRQPQRREPRQRRFREPLAADVERRAPADAPPARGGPQEQVRGARAAEEPRRLPQQRAVVGDASTKPLQSPRGRGPLRPVVARRRRRRRDRLGALLVLGRQETLQRLPVLVAQPVAAADARRREAVRRADLRQLEVVQHRRRRGARAPRLPLAPWLLRRAPRRRRRGLGDGRDRPRRRDGEQETSQVREMRPEDALRERDVLFRLFDGLAVDGRRRREPRGLAVAAAF